MMRRTPAFLILALIFASAHAEVELKSQGMTVFGQSELPKVLYIVPWKRKELPEIEVPQTVSLVNDVLTPIEPGIFERQVRYYELMMQRVQKTK
jgi:hypothetical protein